VNEARRNDTLHSENFSCHSQKSLEENNHITIAHPTVVAFVNYFTIQSFYLPANWDL
jgi:hypothetical protein